MTATEILDAARAFIADCSDRGRELAETLRTSGGRMASARADKLDAADWAGLAEAFETGIESGNWRDREHALQMLLAFEGDNNLGAVTVAVTAGRLDNWMFSPLRGTLEALAVVASGGKASRW